MPRLFTALDLPPAAVDALGAFQRKQEIGVSARWTVPENLHITLRFIGHVGDEQADTVEAALHEARRHAPFEVAPLGLGVLPSRRNPRVLTVRVDPTEPFRAFYRELQDVLATVDVERETRTFRPHITLARLKNASPERLYRALRDMPGPSLAPFPADRFYLYESRRTPDGAVHTIRAVYPFETD